MKTRLLFLYLIFISFMVNSNTLNSPVSKLNVASSPSLVGENFTISPDSPLTLDLLDKCWSKREDLTNQTVIASYLMTMPKVPPQYEVAWKVARLVYFIGNYGIGLQKFTNSNDGVALFEYGMKAAKLAQAQDPSAVEGYYWFAVNLGSYALAKGILSAASNAKDGILALKMAKSIDPSYQYFGPDRIMGRYYEALPAFLGGDLSKALMLIQAAVKNAPNFRGNWLALGRYYFNTGDYTNALQACNKALNLQNLEGKYEEIRYYAEAKSCIARAKDKLE